MAAGRPRAAARKHEGSAVRKSAAPPGGRRPARRLGRRPGDRDTRDQILNAAEEAFARGGYDATSVREIALRARVNPALLQYYFKSKEGLFTAIFVRRGQELANKRLELLDALERRPTRPPVEEIVRAYLTPAFQLMGRGPGGIAFMRLQARLQNDSGELSLNLRTSVYEACIQRYVKALGRALPNQTAELIYWRITFMVGAYLHTISDANRLEIVSGGRCTTRDRDEALRQLVSFFVAGLRAGPPG